MHSTSIRAKRLLHKLWKRDSKAEMILDIFFLGSMPQDAALQCNFRNLREVVWYYSKVSGFNFWTIGKKTDKKQTNKRFKAVTPYISVLLNTFNCEAAEVGSVGLVLATQLQLKLPTRTLDYMLHRFLWIFHVCEGNFNPAWEWRTLPLTMKTTIER